MVKKHLVPVPIIAEDKRDGPWKTIILVGETGTGKSTTLNSMVNFLHGVRYTDPFRYVLIGDGHDKDQSQSVTSSVTAYHLKPANIDVPYEVTLIDGPGFNEATSRKGGFKRQRDSHHYVPQMQLHLP